MNYSENVEKFGYKKAYDLYLESKEWAQKRDQILEQYNHQCYFCGRPYDLQVHHITYDNVGCEKESDLICLCKSCHSSLHDMKSKDMQMLHCRLEKMDKKYLEYRDQYLAEQIAPIIYKEFGNKLIKGHFTKIANVILKTIKMYRCDKGIFQTHSNGTKIPSVLRKILRGE